MIVVEGIDGSGKTTLANALGERFGWPVLHWSTKERVTVAQLLPYVLAGPIVIDRCHLTPLVYGEVLRGHDDWTKRERQWMNEVLERQRCQTILCDVPIEDVWKNVRSRPALFQISREALDVMRREFLQMPYDFRYDYRDNDSYQRLLRMVCENTVVQREEER